MVRLKKGGPSFAHPLCLLVLYHATPAFAVGHETRRRQGNSAQLQGSIQQICSKKLLVEAESPQFDMLF